MTRLVIRTVLTLMVVERMIHADLTGFWPLNCDYYGSDESDSPRLSLLYNASSQTASEFLCSAQESLKGAASFETQEQSDGSIYLEAENPGSQQLGITVELTWIGYMMVPQDVFFDLDVPIFSFEKAQATTTYDSGLGLVWWNAVVVLVLSTSGGSGAWANCPTGMVPDTWYKVAISVNTETGRVVHKVSRLSNNRVTAETSVINSGVRNLAGTPYVNGRIRFGAYAEQNNNGNTRFFRGLLSCVQLYNNAMSMDELNQIWTEIPRECVQVVDPCSDSSRCANTILVPQSGFTAGSCQSHGNSRDGYTYTCLCARGYFHDTLRNICKDIDETVQDNCGCEDVCENRNLEEDGVRFQCFCTHINYILDVDGFSCREILGFSAVPLFGPEAGGTVITIRYNFAAYTSEDGFPHVVVELSGTRLENVTMINGTVITVSTPRYGDGNSSLTGDVSSNLVVMVNGQEVGSSVFVYKPNPILTDVYPLETILAGGTLLTVVGMFLDSVAKPKLLVTGIASSSIDVDMAASITVSTICDVHNSTIMTCPMPALELPNQRRRRRNSETDERILIEFYIGFELDGDTSFRNLSETETLQDKARVVVYINPEFEAFDDVLKYDRAKNERLNIKGDHLDQGATDGDFSVLLELEQCRDVDVLSNHISCVPPKKEPEVVEIGAYERGKIRVYVRVGNYEGYVGQLEYVTSNSVDTTVIIGTSVGAGILVLVAVIVIIVICIKRKKSKQNNAKVVKLYNNTAYGVMDRKRGRDYDNLGIRNGIDYFGMDNAEFPVLRNNKDKNTRNYDDVRVPDSASRTHPQGYLEPHSAPRTHPQGYLEPHSASHTHPQGYLQPHRAMHAPSRSAM